ncbi:MAG: disulfide oxidoreductase [Acidimicrobiia bacterium]|nr:disulfide oxidoreductase [Acidimicrobiia bacterium]
MTTDQVSFFLAVLGFVALALAAAAVVVLVGSAPAAPDGVRSRLGPVRAALGRAGVGVAFAIALTATVGSLYYSEIAHFVPCRLCWYQRIGMYPLVVVLGVALVVGDRGVWRYALPVAALGGAVSLYHYQLQLFPGQGSGACGPEASCTLRYIEQFGFVTIPFLALCGFLSICAPPLLGSSRQTRGD